MWPTPRIALPPSTPRSALSNRAACYLRVGEASSCLEDCNAILALLPKLAEAEGQSEVAVKKRTRLHQRALMRRGAAYMLLHDYTSALTGFRDARDAGAEGMEGDIEHAAEMLDCAWLPAAGRADVALPRCD